MRTGLKNESGMAGRVLVAIVCCVALLFGVERAANASMRALSNGGSTPIKSEQIQQTQGHVNVAIYLRDQNAITAWQKDKRAAKEAAGIAAPGERRFKGREATRQRALKRLSGAAVRTSRPSQSKLAAVVISNGGVVTGSLPAPNILYASLPADAVARVMRSPLVAAVKPVGERRYLGAADISGATAWHSAGCTAAGALDSSCPATSAPQALTGPVNSFDGQGGPDFGVDDQGINCHHVAFTGGPTPSIGRSPSVARPSDAPMAASAGNKGCPNDIAADSGSLHGNTIAAVVGVKDPAHLGAAFGVDKLLDGTRSCASPESWLLGLPTYFYSTTVAPCVQGLTIAGASDPEEVRNRSYSISSVGNPENTSDDSLWSQLADIGATQFGVAQAIAAGNGGPYAPQDNTLRTCYDNPDSPLCQYRVQQPCISYSSICMGANTGGGDATLRTSDDVVAKYSSRGPSVGGRKKPDLVAYSGTGGGCPNGGYSGIANATLDNQWKGGSICGEGTSYAAPYVAAGQLLLAGVGVTAPTAQKSILINSATQVTKEATGTVQQYWAPDVGWGEIDLAQAYADRGNFRTGSITAPPTSNARFYRVSGQSAADRTTLTWNRRVTIPLGSHGDFVPGSASSIVASAVTTLNLYQLTLAGADNDQDVCGASTTCGVDASESTDIGPTSTVGGVVQRWGATTDGQDSVDQVRASTAGDSIIKVVAASPILGAASENYALASTEPLAPLATPTINTPAPTLTNASPAVGENVTVTASATNNSTGTDLVNGLDLSTSQVAINLPSGVALVSGASTQSLGTLNTSQTKTASWVVTRTSEGSGPITFTASGTRFGETFSSTSPGAAITSDVTPPTLDLSAPSGYLQTSTNGVSFTASDGVSGLANVTIEAAVAGGGFQSIYSASDPSGAASVTAPEGAVVEVRARATDVFGNTSADSTASWTVDATPPTLSVSAPSSVFVGGSATVSVAAANVGSPITTSYRVNGGEAKALTGSSLTLTNLQSPARVDVSTTDALGRTVTRTATISTQRRPTQTRLKLAKASRRATTRKITASISPAISGSLKVTAKCGKKRSSKTARVVNGRATIKLRRLGKCRVTARFVPTSADAYSASSAAKSYKL